MPRLDFPRLFAIFAWLLAIAFVFFGSVEAEAADRTVTWTAPTTNVDGSTLTDLAGYQVIYVAVGSPPASGTAVDVPDPNASSVVIDIPAGNWYVMVQAYDQAGNFSQLSAPAYWPLWDPAPMGPSGAQVQ